jgi:hypothetical protein
MALEGQLSDFSLEEILQLIAVQQKSGFLVLRHEQEMVFYFDHGALISVRDRRTPGNDPLGPFLKRYGFLKPEQWAHIEFVLSRASMELTEVLTSEHILDEATLISAHHALAQEMIQQGMQLKQGSYHFTATTDVQTGIRCRLALDIQGLLMEAARRLDEEPRLLAALPSNAMTFEHGLKTAQPNEVSETSARLLKLALAGKTLGEIIGSARVAAFTTREVMQHLCEMGLLVPVKTGLAEVIQMPAARADGETPAVRLRHPTPTLVGALLLLAIGALRWVPALSPERNGLQASAGAAAVMVTAPVSPTGAIAAPPSAGTVAPVEIRLRQIADDLEQALLLYRHAHGRFPADLETLVAEGSLSTAALQMVARIGWTYRPAGDGGSYTISR